MSDVTPTSAKIKRILGEFNPIHWPLAALVTTRDAFSRAASLPETPHSNARVGKPTSATLDAIMHWLARAQDATRSGGVSAYYALYGGFTTAYPETTGYIVPTMLRYAALRNASEFEGRAKRALEWLLTLQFPNGAFPGGFAEKHDGPSVFNSGQILFGLTAGIRRFDEPRYKAAAERVSDWLGEVQATSGCWDRCTYEGRVHVYYTMVAWALADYANATGDRRAADAALKNVMWAVQQQEADAYFQNYNLGDRPVFLHFIAYAVQGLLEASLALAFEEGVRGAQKAAETLLRRFESRKHLAGAYRAGWKADAQYECVTGNAQTALVWQRCAQATGDLRYFNAALKMNERIKRTIALRQSPAIMGGVPGSFPIWGKYLWYRYPNWAAKFTADSLMNELTMLEQIKSGSKLKAFSDDRSVLSRVNGS